MKNILHGEGGLTSSLVYFTLLDAPPNAELVSQLAQEVYNSDLLESLISNMEKLEFEVSDCNT